MLLDSPLITVVMPAYNAAAYIREAIQSVLVQTYKNIELLICDDGSSDGTQVVVESFDDLRIRFFRNDKNLGNLRTTNFLFSQAKGDLIAIQDSDDISENNRLECLYRFLLDRRDYGIVGSAVLRIDEGGREISVVRNPLTHEEILDRMTGGGEPCVVYGSIMFRKEILASVGYFRSYFDRLGAADYDWIYRSSFHFKIGNLALPLYRVRKHTRSFTASFSKNPLRRVSPKIAFFLFDQRLKSGTDFLDQNREDELTEISRSLVSQYYADSSLLYFEHYELLMWRGRRIEAFQYLLKAWLLRPFAIRHLKALAYFVKNSILERQ